MFELTRVKAASPDIAVIDARVPAAAREEFAKATSALRDKKPENATPHLEKALVIYPGFFKLMSCSVLLI